MNNKELKQYYEEMTLGEIKGIYEERCRVLNNMKRITKENAEKIILLDTENINYINRLTDLADSIKSYTKDMKIEIQELAIIKPILDKKESEGINQEEYENYMSDNKDNIKLLIQRVEEMKQKAITEWVEWEEKDIINIHEGLLKELIMMLKDNVGNITEITKLDYNNNRGFDGWIKGDKGHINIDTILAGGHTVQCLHYRTLIRM